MYSIEKEFKFEYGHRLMKHQGACKNLHGHSARIAVKIEADTLNDNDMVIDFNDLKFIEDRINTQFDHSAIFNKNDPLFKLLQSSEVCQEFKLIAMDDDPTSEIFAKLFAEQINEDLEFQFKSITVTFWETAKNSASYTVYN